MVLEPKIDTSIHTNGGALAVVVPNLPMDSLNTKVCKEVECDPFIMLAEL